MKVITPDDSGDVIKNDARHFKGQDDDSVGIAVKGEMQLTSPSTMAE